MNGLNAWCYYRGLRQDVRAQQGKQLALCHDLLRTALCNRQEAGCNFTSVIRNGQMLGVADRRNGNTLSLGWRQQPASDDAGEARDTPAPCDLPQEAAFLCASCHVSISLVQIMKGSPSACCLRLGAGAVSPSGQPQAEEDPFRPQSDRDTARATAAVGVLGGQPTGTLQLLGDVKLREFFNDGGKVSTGCRVSPVRV